MKHPERGTIDVAHLTRLCDDIGLHVKHADADLMLSYLRCILTANERVNVTSIRTVADAVRLHLVDSLVALPEVSGSADGGIVDVGSGGGFPGVPLAIATSRATVMLDSVGRKVDVVNECLAKSGAQRYATAVCARSEEYARQGEELAACAVSRAVAELPTVLELSRPLVREGGLIVTYKARLEDAEHERGRRAAELLGLQEDSVREAVLPDGGERRVILAWRVVGPAELALPRRVGLAGKRPLA